MTSTQSTDPTRSSLIDAISAKVELADKTTDPTAKARIEGSISRMVKALDEDPMVHVYRHGIFVRACSADSAQGYIQNLVSRGYGQASEYEVR